MDVSFITTMEESMRDSGSKTKCMDKVLICSHSLGTLYYASHKPAYEG